MSTPMTLDESAPSTAPTAPRSDDFGGRSGGRAFRDQLARVVMWTAFVVAGRLSLWQSLMVIIDVGAEHVCLIRFWPVAYGLRRPRGNPQGADGRR